MKRIQVDERRELVIPGDREETIAYATQHWIELAKEAIANRGRFVVALSGGSTPKAIFEKLRHIPLEWDKVFLFWSDERAVPPESPDSNYHMAMEAAFKYLPLKHVYRMKGEGLIQESAAEYEKLVASHLPFDLIMLGMGDDGHTASLFPGTEALSEKERLVVANYIPQKKCWRMTMTYPCINSARHIVFYVLGGDKKERLAEVLEPNCKLPAALVGSSGSRAMWVADTQAVG